MIKRKVIDIMGLITKEVEVGLIGSNIKHYENLNYEIPRVKDDHYRLVVPKNTKLLVKVEDLPNNSDVSVNIKCDHCGKKLVNIKWYNYKRCVKEDGKYYCIKCANELYGKEKIRKTKFENSISYYDWCYENLPKDEADNIMLRWDYELNIRNREILNPNNISYASHGFNNKGYWFKCLDYPEHKSELKNIYSFTGGLSSINCKQCNTIAITHPKLIEYFINIDDINKYTHGSNKKLSMKCPICGYEKKISISTLISQGFGCPKCSDGIPYPEKIMFNVLEQLGLDFIVQLNKSNFNWCNKYKYDFYIPLINGIIETHGDQHYNKSFYSTKKGKTLEEEQENDRLKKNLALNNNIINYIVIDCRKSELEWIKNSIINSVLNNLFDLSNINWQKCEEYACTSLVKIVCDLWNSGIHNMQKIAKELKLDRHTILKYIKRGVNLNLCNYNKEEESNKKLILMQQNNCKKILCINTNEIFNSGKIGGEKYNINANNIYACCRGRQKSAGIYPITGEKMVWKYI